MQNTALKTENGIAKRNERYFDAIVYNIFININECQRVCCIFNYTNATPFDRNNQINQLID